MRVLIATVKVPFIRGGAEAHAAGLLRALQARGYEADIVEIPFKHYPPERILDHVLACRLLDLSEAFGNTIDRLIGLKFPAYAVPHPHKVLWILHQHRPAYDLWEHPQAGDLKYAPNGCYIRDAIRQADREFIGEARAVFANSRNVAERLRLGCGITAEPLYHPPPGAESFYCERARDYILFPSRINLLKRQKLAIEALALTREPVRLMFIGAADSPELESECARLASHLGVASRIDWMGAVPEQAKYDAYARCLGVLFPPLDEDYGYVTLEAMLSSKSVITCADSGGPLEFVVNGETGLVVQPSPEALAEAMDSLWRDRSRAAQMGSAARERYAGLGISWDRAIERLLA